MEPIAALTAAPKSSLIVKLRYQPLCARCADMLPRWCEPPAGQYWKWTLDELTQSSSTCRCCQFLAQILEASPWIKDESYGSVAVEVCKVGFQHTAKLPACSVSKTYCRPVLYAGRWNMFHSKRRSFILPVSVVHDATLNEIDPQVFCGRPVNAMTDLSLIASWHKICVSRHDNSAGSHVCRPSTHKLLQGFRVIDVQQRCVVRTSGKVDYAALSYVWGNAKRLVLSKDNEAWLTTPGALAQTEENVPKTFRDALEVAAALGVANLWVDAICIDQSNPEQVKHHMDSMDKIYGSAVLTIVATAENADLGLPGISPSRGPPQAVFQHNGIRYLSAKMTFGAAMKDCPWEKRAWCFQEKLFSTRLLVFTDIQVFYQCGTAMWYEDTITEVEDGKQYTLSDSFSGGRSRDALKDGEFGSLVESYSRREMSFESDVIRAFAGVLRYLEAQYGHAIWGIPQYLFPQGLLWCHSQHRMSLRLEGFPSWSWVAWRTQGIDLYLVKGQREDPGTGKYHFSRGKAAGRSVWDRPWYYHATDRPGGQVQLKAVQLKPQDRNMEPQSSSPMVTAVLCTVSEPLKEAAEEYNHLHDWGLPGHPGGVEPAPELVPPLAPGPEMPPLSHIIRFYTSVITVFVHSERTKGFDKNRYRLLVPGTDIEIARVLLDPLWSGIGKVHSLVYISRDCPYWTAHHQDESCSFECLYLLLIESVPGWGEVKSRVQLVQKVSVMDWGKANPRWELVSLA